MPRIPKKDMGSGGLAPWVFMRYCIMDFICKCWLCIHIEYFIFHCILSFQVFGPVLVVLTFRTAKEAIALANNTMYGLAGSVWTENMSLALEVAMSIRAGAIWINGHNLFDAAAGFGGMRDSGFGRDGGKEVLLLNK